MPSLGGSISSLRSPGEHLGPGVLPALVSRLASAEPAPAAFVHLCSFLRCLSGLPWPQRSTECSLVCYRHVSVSFLTGGLTCVFPG